MRDLIRDQAEELARCLPAIIRRLFALDEAHPVAEMPLAQLRALGALGSAPRTVSALSEELGISVSAVTQVADRMERVGLVERIPEPDDRRVRILQLTAAGREVLASRHERRVLAIQTVLETMAPDVRSEVLDSLEKLLRASQAGGLETGSARNPRAMVRVEH